MTTIIGPTESLSSDDDMRITSVMFSCSKVAAVSFNLMTKEILIMESMSDVGPQFNVTRMLLRCTQPKVVIVSSVSGKTYVDALSTIAENEVTIGSVIIKTVHSRFFNYLGSKRKVLGLNLCETLTNLVDEEKVNYILASVNLADERLVSSFGALITSVAQYPAEFDIGPTPVVSVSSISHVTFDNATWLDSETYKHLQIFDPIHHPSSFKWSNQSSGEGLSFYNLLEKFCSPIAKPKLRTFMVQPTSDIGVIERRHDVIRFYIDPNFQEVVASLRIYVSKLSQPTALMGYLSVPDIRGGHWKCIYRNIYYSTLYAELCRAHSQNVELFQVIGESLNDVVYSMAHNLERVFDFVNMEKGDGFVIKHGVYPPLDQAKERLSNVKSILDMVTPHEFDAVPPFITRIRMLYIPEIKFLLSVPFWKEHLTIDELHLEDLEYKFSVNKIAYYKSRRCIELDNTYGDPQTDILTEEMNIIRYLGKYLKEHIHHVINLINKIMRLECIFALARLAQEHDYVQPQMTPGVKLIKIVNARHPLLHVLNENFIPNDFISTPDSGLVKIINGPNASGKTIYMKQVALICYMAHIGSFVPAEEMQISPLTQIHALSHKSETVLSNISSFFVELKHICTSVNSATSDTLLIFDEIGKGGNEINSSALLYSCIKHFSGKGAASPHFILSTHLSLEDDLRNEPNVSFHAMGHALDDDQIVFLYKVVQGTPRSNFVFEVLETCAVAQPIVATTRHILETLRTDGNVLPYCTMRLDRSCRYYRFAAKFAFVDMNKTNYMEKLKNKVKSFYEIQAMNSTGSSSRSHDNF